MLKSFKIVAAAFALTSLSATAWAQAGPQSVSICCTSTDNNDPSGTTIARDCTTSALTPNSVNSCSTIVFSCGSRAEVECAPPASGAKNKKDCSCSTFAFGD